jgi:hypothetical protein
VAVFIDGRKLCFENGSFDISYSSAVVEVIEHVEGVLTSNDFWEAQGSGSTLKRLIFEFLSLS